MKLYSHCGNILSREGISGVADEQTCLTHGTEIQKMLSAKCDCSTQGKSSEFRYIYRDIQRNEMSCDTYINAHSLY